MKTDVRKIVKATLYFLANSRPQKLIMKLNDRDIAFVAVNPGGHDTSKQRRKRPFKAESRKKMPFQIRLQGKNAFSN